MLRLLSLFSLLGLVACGVGDVIDRNVDKTVTVLDEAIRELDNNSSDWQRVLSQTRDKLTEDAQSTLRNEIDTLLKRGVAAVGGELRCNTDFLGKRMVSALRRLKRELFGSGDAPPLEPVICSVTPMAVDTELVKAGRLSTLEIYGYDFDTAKVELQLLDAGKTVDQTLLLARPSHYHLTVPFGNNGVKFSATSQQLRLLWNGMVQSTIAVIQPGTRPCKVQEDRRIPASIAVWPVLRRGDAEFDGNGPKMTASLGLQVINNRVVGSLFASALEVDDSGRTTGDGTYAYDTKTADPLYTAPVGFRIKRLLTGASAQHQMIDGGGHLCRQMIPGSGPVKWWTFCGDNRGQDVGRFTRVEVDFTEIRVELEEVGTCMPSK